MQADAENGGDAEFAGHDVLQFVNAAAQAFQRAEDLAAGLQKSPALRREGKVFPPPLDQFHMIALLDGPHLLAHGTLGDAIDLGSTGKTGGLREVGKDLEGLDLHRTSENKIN